MKSAYVGLIVALSGAMFITMGHYFEEWILAYLLCPILGVATSLTLGDMDKK